MLILGNFTIFLLLQALVHFGIFSMALMMPSKYCYNNGSVNKEETNCRSEKVVKKWKENCIAWPNPNSKYWKDGSQVYDFLLDDLEIKTSIKFPSERMLCVDRKTNSGGSYEYTQTYTGIDSNLSALNKWQCRATIWDRDSDIVYMYMVLYLTLQMIFHELFLSRR